jgi:protein-S-isoprenylcysteine O-methyltransferase Ste14
MTTPAWKEHILSTIAGAFSIAQLIVIFTIPGGEIVIIRVVGWIIWAISILFGWLPMVHLKKYGHVKNGKAYVHTEQLVDKGIYSIVRHPQYLALPLFNIGLMLISQNWVVIILGIPAIFLMIPDLIRADSEGIEKFGDQYLDYSKKVPKLNFILGIFRYLKRKIN